MIVLSRILYVEDDFRKLSSQSVAATRCIHKDSRNVYPVDTMGHIARRARLPLWLFSPKF